MVAYSFSKKLLQFSFSLGVGNFGGSGGNTATINVEGTAGQGPAALRASTTIQYLGGPTSGIAEGAIYGLPLSMMNQLTTLGTQWQANFKNSIQISAGDEQSGLSLIFVGDLYSVYMDGSALPQVPLRFQATADWSKKLQMIPPTSVQGSADVATIMGQLAQKAGLQFENNGVNVKVSNPYLPGAVRVQMSELASMAGIQHIVDKGTLAIWPTGGSRAGGGGLISKNTGMIGFPSFESANVVPRMLFDPSFSPGQNFVVQSDVQQAANGTWNCIKIVRELESEMPSGKWFQTLWGTPAGQQTQTSSN